MNNFWQDPKSISEYLRMSRSDELDWFELKVNWPSLASLIPKGDKVLDFGCGGGEYTDQIAEITGGTVDACDFSEEMIQEFESTHEHKLFVWDGKKTDGLADTYDVIVAKLVLMFVDDLNELADSFYKVLRPGGTVALSVIHPLQSINQAGKDNSVYLEEFPYTKTFREINMSSKFIHRPLNGWISPFLEAGFVLTGIKEPTIPDEYLDLAKERNKQYLSGPKRLNFTVRKDV